MSCTLLCILSHAKYKSVTEETQKVRREGDITS